eukprot:1152209-Pelagomonas_calceolata.AAC.4
MIKVPDWRTWAYTNVSCHTQKGKQEIGADVQHKVYCPLTNSIKLVEPNGARVTNTICRAEQAAIVAAITHSYPHIASDSLTSIHQIRKQLIHPEKHRQHIQGDDLKNRFTLICNSQANICVYKVKSHAGNECADAIANYQAKQAKNSVADTGNPSAGPGGNPFDLLFPPLFLYQA